MPEGGKPLRDFIVLVLVLVLVLDSSFFS